MSLNCQYFLALSAGCPQTGFEKLIRIPSKYIQVFLAFYLNLKFPKSMLVMRNFCTDLYLFHVSQYMSNSLFNSLGFVSLTQRMQGSGR